MSPELFWAASSLVGAGAAISKLADSNPVLGALAPPAFKLVTNFAALAWIPLLLSGFFLFRWYDPLIAFSLGWVVVLPLHGIAKSGNVAAYYGATTVACLVGAACAIAMFFVGGIT